MQISDLLKLFNSENIEKIVSILSNTNLAQPQQNSKNYSQNDLNSEYFQLPHYTTQPLPQTTTNFNFESILNLIKLILPLLNSTQKKSEPTSPDFKSEILSLTKIK